MAGEDPGVGVITLILDLIRRGWDAVTGVAKSFVGGIMDIAKTYMFISWRRKMFEQAYKDFGGRLPVHVRFILDEFANMGVIPDADKKLSVMRSRSMGACIFKHDAQAWALFRAEGRQ